MGGARRLPGAILRSWASSTLVRRRASRVATDSTSQCRETRAGSVRRVLSHLRAKPSSIHTSWAPPPQEADPRVPCSAYQTTSRVQRRWAVGGPKAVPRAGNGDEGAGGQSFATVGAEGDVLPVAHTGMPALLVSAATAWGWISPVAEHAFLEQFHRGVHPGAFWLPGGCSRPRGWRNCL